MKTFKNKRKFWMAPVFLAGLAILIFLIMFLWNSLMPNIFHLPQISYWEAAGLLILSRILFGFKGGWEGHRRGHLRNKWEQMNPEDREKFINHLKENKHSWTVRNEQRTSQENSYDRNL